MSLPDRVKGRLQICCIAYDTTPIHVPAPWSHMPVAPARVRYRIFCAGKCVLPLRAGVDLRVFRKPDMFRAIYGPETRQNHPNKPGLYCFILAHDWNSAAFPNDHYNLEVQAADVHGNRRVLHAPVQDPQLGVGLASGSMTTCSRWNAPIGLSLRPCTLGRRSTSWRA